MSMVIAIDPGKFSLGWSAWVARKLVGCGLARAERGHHMTIGDLAASMAGQLPTKADVAVVERMVYGYTRIQAKGVKAMARVAADLLDLQAIGGFVAGHSIREGGTIEWFSAHQWKGEAKKEMTDKHVRKALSPEELEIFQEAFLAIPKNLRHNMTDGVGLGLYYRGRKGQ